MEDESIFHNRIRFLHCRETKQKTTFLLSVYARWKLILNTQNLFVITFISQFVFTIFTLLVLRLKIADINSFSAKMTAQVVKIFSRM